LLWSGKELRRDKQGIVRAERLWKKIKIRFPFRRWNWQSDRFQPAFPRILVSQMGGGKKMERFAADGDFRYNS
jgi:hypothetical protein